MKFILLLMVILLWKCEMFYLGVLRRYDRRCSILGSLFNNKKFIENLNAEIITQSNYLEKDGIDALVVWNKVTWCNFLLATFKSIKRIPANAPKFYSYAQTSPWPLLTLKIIKFIMTIKNYAYKSENTLITLHTNNFYNNHHTNIMRINVFCSH